MEIMVSYIQPVDETWYITAGEYHSEINAVVPASKRLEMLKYAWEIRFRIKGSHYLRQKHHPN